MAGIVGVAQTAPGDPSTLLNAMAQRLVHHDRCVVGKWHDARAGLAHVAASATLAGRQFFRCESSGRCIVFFGECLGCDDELEQLKRAGVRLREPFNDAEFCLRVYERYGEAGFRRLNGSYCFAIVDERHHEYLLVSDRLGSRPLFYGIDSERTLHFGSQVSCVLQAPGISRQLDTAAVLEFCANQRVFGDKTYHEGVKTLPPGSSLRFRDGRAQTSEYWALNYSPEQASLDEHAERLAVTVKRAVRRLSARGGRLGILLSGGLDARMMAAAADVDTICFTFGDYENFETSVARRIAQARGFEFRFLQRPPDQYADMLDLAVEIGSGMHPFNHAHALGLIGSIEPECDVLTHGYGTEILFRSSSVPRVPRRVFGLELGRQLDGTLTEGNLEARLLDRSNTLMNKGIDALLTPVARESMRQALADASRSLVAESAGHASDIYDRFLWPDVRYRGRFPSFVFESSIRCFMAEASIDFDNEVIDLHTRIPAAIRGDGRLWMLAMERLHKGIAHLVSANTGYSPCTPPGLVAVSERLRSIARLPSKRDSEIKRAESASKVPTDGLSPISWPRFDVMVRKNARLRERIVTTLQDPEALPPPIFDHGKIKALFESHLAGRTHSRHVLFALLTFGVWHKKYGVQHP